jgi:hypothetical protein
MKPQIVKERRIFKSRWFAHFARRQKITDRDLCDAVARAQRGLMDADLGGGVIKQRIARPQQGRSGGFRSIVLFQAERHSFFVYGFAKNQRDNISRNDLKEFRRLSDALLILNNAQLQPLLDEEEFSEVKCDEENL